MRGDKLKPAKKKPLPTYISGLKEFKILALEFSGVLLRLLVLACIKKKRATRKTVFRIRALYIVHLK